MSQLKNSLVRTRKWKKLVFTAGLAAICSYPIESYFRIALFQDLNNPPLTFVVNWLILWLSGWILINWIALSHQMKPFRWQEPKMVAAIIIGIGGGLVMGIWGIVPIQPAEHQLEVIALRKPGGEIKSNEVRIERIEQVQFLSFFREIVPLERFTPGSGWKMEENSFLYSGNQEARLFYRGMKQEGLLLTFLGTPIGGKIEIRWNGQPQVVDLYRPRVEMINISVPSFFELPLMEKIWFVTLCGLDGICLATLVWMVITLLSRLFNYDPSEQMFETFPAIFFLLLGWFISILLMGVKTTPWNTISRNDTYPSYTLSDNSLQELAHSTILSGWLHWFVYTEDLFHGSELRVNSLLLKKLNLDPDRFVLYTHVTMKYGDYPVDIGADKAAQLLQTNPLTVMPNDTVPYTLVILPHAPAPVICMQQGANNVFLGLPEEMNACGD
jgi:hypothetical protein